MKRLTRRKRGFLIVLLAGGATAAFAAKFFFDYAAAPVTQKDCAFTYPDAQQSATATSPTPLPQSLPLAQERGFINDASCLNKTAIYGIVTVREAEDVRRALQFARENQLKVSIAGRRHSMGGQSFVQDGLVLDMMSFNQIRVDPATKVLNVQSGATWEQVQQVLDAEGLSVKAMQSINAFTVGGTLSVNGHGIAHDPGPIASTVRSFRIMLSSGETRNASPNENPELFRLALGGYGLIGVILDADLDVVSNEVYDRQTSYLSYRDFPKYYRTIIEGNPQVGLAYARLSISPDTYLTEVAAHTYEQVDFKGSIPAVTSPENVGLQRFVLNFSKTGSFGRWLRWTAEKHLEPRLHLCLPAREGDNVGPRGCLVSRNQEMSTPMQYLQNRLADTDILQEYFIPPEKMPEFVDGLRRVVRTNGANLIHVTIRIVHRDDVTALPYAKQDMLALVLYFNQELTDAASRNLEKTTSDLVDLALAMNGTFYLPYQLYYSGDQLRRAYPEVDAFFAAKRQYDPTGTFSNKFYEKYAD